MQTPRAQFLLVASMAMRAHSLKRKLAIVTEVEEASLMLLDNWDTDHMLRVLHRSATRQRCGPIYDDIIDMVEGKDKIP